MLSGVVPKRCGCGELFFVPVPSVADTFLPDWQTKFEQAMCPACSTQFELGMARAALAMGELGAALLHLKHAEEHQDDDAGDDPCATCHVQGCNGSHCLIDGNPTDPDEKEFLDSIVSVEVDANVRAQQAMGYNCIHLATCNYGMNGCCISDMGCPEYDNGEDDPALFPNAAGVFEDEM